MILGLFNFGSGNKLQDVYLGSGSYFLRVSDKYLTERDEADGTVIIYPEGPECITLRISILTFQSKDDEAASTTGYNFVVQNAEQENRELYFENNMAVAFHQSHTVDKGVPLLMQFWEIGLQDNILILMSATIWEEKQQDKKVKKLLASIPDIIKSIEPTEKHDSIETASGVVNYTTQQTPIEQEIIELEPEEKDFIQKWNTNGHHIISYFNFDYQPADVSFQLLDSTFIQWLDDENEEKFNPDAIAHGLGIVFGELLAKKLDMKWVKVRDEYGEEFAIRGQDNLMSFPVSSVQKRIETEETGFFNHIFEMLLHMRQQESE